MHPTYNAGRRQHRARLLTARYPTDPEACYTDAAAYRSLQAYAAMVVLANGTTLATATSLTGSTTAEEVAIALVVVHALTSNVTVLTDSQAAC